MSDNPINITEMKCPGCGSTLKMPQDGSRFVKCEYCGGEYAVNGLHGMPRQAPNWRPAPAPPQYSQEKSGPPTGLMVAGGFVAMVVIICLFVIFGNKKEDEASLAEEKEFSIEFEQSDTGGYGWRKGGQTGEQEETAFVNEAEFSGLLGEVVSRAFGKEAESVTPQELSQIKWIADKGDFDNTYIGYSFDDPMENPDAEIEWFTYPDEIGEDYDMGYEALGRLTGLKKLETSEALSQLDLRGLKLESFTAYIYSFSDAAAALDDPSLLRELGTKSSIDSLEGLERFPNVEKLSIYAPDLSDVSALAAMPNLKSLTLENADALSDFAAFGTINNLEELILESENIKALNFLNRIPNLKSLGIADGALLDLSGLEELSNLEKLSVTDCRELKDMKAVEQMTGLKELTLEKPYDCEEPSLAGLTGLEKLTLKSFSSCGFLQNLTNLKKLSLQSCDLPSGIDLSGLTQLKELSCTTSWDERSFAFVGKITSLESVNMKGIVTYDDISGVFMLPNLKKLDLSGAECEINFSKIAENQSLESLKMSGIKLYENVSVSGGGGIVYVDWDDVFLKDHLDFIQSFPNLRTLDIAENEIQDISAVQSLGKLEEIDLSDNYVTELRPLAAIPSLRLVKCKGNPIGNLQALDESIVIINE